MHKVNPCHWYPAWQSAVCVWQGRGGCVWGGKYKLTSVVISDTSIACSRFLSFMQYRQFVGFLNPGNWGMKS